jgi:NAD-dependent dihydropyrimidine dehydrogenase PreA subunit
MSEKGSSGVDIFGLLSNSGEKAEKADKADRTKQREELLAAAGVKEFFSEGSISINKYTCVGVQCKLCIKACPTNALYWKSGKVGIVEDLCVYCGACVLSCMVDDCMKVKRKRESGEVERFGKVRDVVVLANCLNAKRRFLRVREVFGSWDAYCEKYGRGK